MGSPLLFNEALWSIGMSTLTAIYSLCGLTVVSALSINSTISNLFNVVFMSMGTAVSVMVGQALGADDYDRARSTAWKLAAFGVAGAIAMALLLILADAAAKLIAPPVILPIGAIMSFIGGPVFLILLFRGRGGND